MKLPSTIPMPLFIGVVIFLALLFGSFLLGTATSSGSPAQPVYITDGTGSNPTAVSCPGPHGTTGCVVNVNKDGHLSVHIADGGLPTFTGSLDTRHMAYPSRPGLAPGECYAAFIRGGGEFYSASVTFDGHGAGKPQALVRVDTYPVWVVMNGSNATPISPITGLARAGNTYLFGYSLPLSFKAFAGVMLCWHGKGVSDGFEVQMMIANGGSSPYDQEEYTIRQQGNVFSWHKLQGPKPASYAILATKSTYVSYLVHRGPDVSSGAKCTPVGSTPVDCLHRVGHRVTFVPHQYNFSETVSALPCQKKRVHGQVKCVPVVYPRYYLFENQAGGTPTRVGPFGDWTGE